MRKESSDRARIALGDWYTDSKHPSQPGRMRVGPGY